MLFCFLNVTYTLQLAFELNYFELNAFYIYICIFATNIELN